MWLRPSTTSYSGFSLDMDRSPGFGPASADLRSVKTRFPSGSGPEALSLASTRSSPDRSTKSTRSHIWSAPAACRHSVSGSLSLPSRGAFHLSLTVLYSIGHWVVFSLTGWSPLIHTGYHVSGATLDPAGPPWDSRTRLSRSVDGLSSTIPLSASVPYAVRTPTCSHVGLGSSAFARRYLRNHCYFLFLRLLRCFSSPGLPPV